MYDSVHIKENIRIQTCTEKRSCEATRRRWPSTRNGERPQQKPSVLLTPWCLAENKFMFSHYIYRTDADAPVLRPPDAKSQLSGKRPWCWERLKAEGEGDDRGWDGWMASRTRWTWVWASSGSWWWTGKSGVLWSTGSQRVGHDWVTELNWTVSELILLVIVPFWLCVEFLFTECWVLMLSINILVYIIPVMFHTW